MNKEPIEKNGGNQSLIRGLRLIDILSNYPNGCPLAKLAEIAELNKSTVHRLLQGLQQEGFIRPATTAGSYRLTTKCLSIGHKMFSSLNIINVASSYLEQLTTGMMRTRAYIGQHLQLYCSAMGKLYMAYDKPDYTTVYWQKNQNVIQRLTCNTITELAVMEKELQDIRAQGFAMDKEENELGISCIACPIFNFENKVEYSLSVSLSTLKLKQLGVEYLLTEIKRTAIAVSQELGWEGER